VHEQTVLTLLARIYNTDVRNLLDYDDRRHLPRTDRLLLAKNPGTPCRFSPSQCVPGER
jgi:hypothetical protein